MAAEVREEIEWSLRTLQERQGGAILHRDYYRGKQRQMIRPERLRTVFGHLFHNFNVNLCRPVVDALADRLQVAGFSSENEEHERAAEELWSRNHLDLRSGYVHQEAIASGDAYLIVWPGPDDEVRIYPHSGKDVAVRYDENDPGRMLYAAKLWVEEPIGGRGSGRVRLTLYLPDRIERYYAQGRRGYFPTAKQFRPFEEDGPAVIPNPHGQVPVFHFANNADVGEFGRSELESAIPIQDALNYKYFSLLVGIEFHALPQRYVVNVEDPRQTDEVTGEPKAIPTGMGRLLAFTGLPRQEGDAGEHAPQIGQFPPADLSGLRETVELAAMKMSAVTATPVHFFLPSLGQAATPASGEAQKTADLRLAAKVRDRQISFGLTWAKAMEFALRLSGYGEDVSLSTEWHETGPRSERETWEVAQLKIKAGVPPRQVLLEAGYPPDLVDRWEEETENAIPPQRDITDVLDDLGL